MIFCLYHYMAKLATTFELALAPRQAGAAAFRWLYSALRAEILSGRLGAGSRLPATRDLARQYGLARGTIVNAFDQLKSEGYIEGSVGSGTYVSEVLPEEFLHVVPRSGATAARRARRTHLSEYGRRARLFPGYGDRPIRAFRANLPALNLFPIELWAQITARNLRRISQANLMGCDALGYLPLRKAVAEYLKSSRGVRCVAEQVAIVSGVQEALDLAARVLLDPGDRVCMENLSFPGAALVFRAIGARISVAGLDKEGIRVDQLPAHGARLVYITPGHQFPLGTTMSIRRRLELLAWARKSGTMIFEDDYDSEYRYSGRPIPALQGLDSDALVLYAGNFSKVMFPALRLGYVVIPSGLVSKFEAVKSLTSRHAPVLDQAVLGEFINEGHFGRHLRRMREIYAERLEVLIEAARERLTGLLEISAIEAGLQTVGWLRGGITSGSATEAAEKRGVDVIPLGVYSLGKAAPEAIQMGFAAVDSKEIRRGVQELAIALEGVR
jgi:GntR family transcriptional regulator / MocR family aminotransferase